MDLHRNLVQRVNVDELLRTSTGKIQENVVREHHAAHYEGTS